MKIRKYEFNKLIRSKIPARMVEEGVRINKSELSDDDYAKQLKLKLLEEAEEVFTASSKNKITEELADVMEVINTILTTYGIAMEEVEQKRVEKREINGDFRKENYINFIEVEESNQEVIAYLEDKDRPYKLVKTFLNMQIL